MVTQKTNIVAPANKSFNLGQYYNMPTQKQGFTKLSDFSDGRILGMPQNKFQQFTGTLAHAIAPQSTGGRMGLAFSNLAAQEMQKEEALAAEKRKFQRGAPARKLGMDLTRAQIEKAKRPGKIGESESFILSRMKDVDAATGKPFTRTEATKEYHQLKRAPQRAQHHFVQDDKGVVSVFENGKLIKGSGLGKTVKKPSGIKLITDDKGNVSVFEGGKLVKGTGKGKTKRIPAGKSAVDTGEKYRTTRRKAVTSQMKEWTGSDEAYEATPEMKRQKKKQLSTAYDAEIKDWQETELSDGRIGYIKQDGSAVDEFGKKAEAIETITTQEQFDKLPEGAIYIEDGVKYKKPVRRAFTEDGTTYHPRPKRN